MLELNEIRTRVHVYTCLHVYNDKTISIIKLTREGNSIVNQLRLVSWKCH